MAMSKILVTGASGFLGRALVPALTGAGHAVRLAVRHHIEVGARLEMVTVGDLAQGVDWSRAVSGVDSVIHLAARVHVMRDRLADPIAAYRTVNRDATLALARAAAQAGARRFLFVSTIKVLGEATSGRPFTESDAADPQDPYSVSKWEAEQGLRAIEAGTGMAVVVVRPPLVYGPGVGGNLRRLMRLVDAGIPLPFGAIANRRTMVGQRNLADLLVRCVDSDAAAGRTFLAADSESASTAELIRLIARGLGRRTRLIPVPVFALRAMGAVSGSSAQVDRLISSLEVDNAFVRRTLGWVPPVPLEAGIAEMARAFQAAA